MPIHVNEYATLISEMNVTPSEEVTETACCLTRELEKGLVVKSLVSNVTKLNRRSYLCDSNATECNAEA